MDLKETVFRDVHDGLQTDFKGKGHARDVQMIERAQGLVAEAPREEAPDRGLPRAHEAHQHDVRRLLRHAAMIARGFRRPPPAGHGPAADCRR